MSFILDHVTKTHNPCDPFSKIPPISLVFFGESFLKHCQLNPDQENSNALLNKLADGIVAVTYHKDKITDKIRDFFVSNNMKLTTKNDYITFSALNNEYASKYLHLLTRNRILTPNDNNVNDINDVNNVNLLDNSTAKIPPQKSYSYEDLLGPADFVLLVYEETILLV